MQIASPDLGKETAGNRGLVCYELKLIFLISELIDCSIDQAVRMGAAELEVFYG